MNPYRYILIYIPDFRSQFNSDVLLEEEIHLENK